MGIARNIRLVKDRIAAAAERSGRKPGEVRLVAVTKYALPEQVLQVIEAGVTDLGENRVQDGLAKIKAVNRPDLVWHFIGSLQTNKVRQVFPAFSLIHSLDRWRLAEELQKRGEELGMVVPALIEVNVSGEPTKHGISPEELPDFLDALLGLSHISPQGLMTMAPLVERAEETRPVFRELRRLFVRMADEKRLGGYWRHLSMGMSNDYEIAVEEGATIVRIGTAVFSPD